MTFSQNGVFEARKAVCVPPLKESQLKRWWSTYHRKQKQIAEDLVKESRQFKSLNQGSSSKEIIYFFYTCMTMCCES